MKVKYYLIKVNLYWFINVNCQVNWINVNLRDENKK